jgi:hypothetical protein
MGNEGMKHEFMVPYTPEQNAVSERDNRTIMEAIRSCIFHNQVDPKLWAEAVDNIVYALNRTCFKISLMLLLLKHTRATNHLCLI